MIPANEAFDGIWPFVPKFSNAAGFRQHDVDEGRGMVRSSSVCTVSSLGTISVAILSRRWPSTTGSSFPITWASGNPRRRQTASAP